MACACRKRKQATSYAVQERPVAPPEPAIEPHTLTSADGTVETFPSKLAAHMERIKRGGGTVAPVSATRD